MTFLFQKFELLILISVAVLSHHSFAEAMPDVKCQFHAQIMDVDTKLTKKFKVKIDSILKVLDVNSKSKWPTIKDCGIQSGHIYAAEYNGTALLSMGDKVDGVSHFNNSKDCIPTEGQENEVANHPSLQISSKMMPHRAKR